MRRRAARQLPFDFDSYLTTNSCDPDWRALGLARHRSLDPANFDLAAVNVRLARLDDLPPLYERHSSCALQVELTEAEVRFVAEHGSLSLTKRGPSRRAPRAMRFWFYLPEAMALARNLAVAANRIAPVPCSAAWSVSPAASSAMSTPGSPRTAPCAGEKRRRSSFDKRPEGRSPPSPSA